MTTLTTPALTTRALPIGTARLPRPALRRAVAAAALCGAVLLGGWNVTTLAGTLPNLSAVRLQVAAPALTRAVQANAAIDDANGAPLTDRVTCWRQAHRLGQDPASCASAPVR